MAEMLILAEDRISDDPHNHAQLHKRGEVIAIQDDGAYWGSGDRELGPIASVPGATIDDLSAYIQEDVADHREYRLLRRRTFYFDLDQWDGGILTLAQALALKVRHGPLFNPDIIGAG